jgi:adenylate cyclase
MGNERAGDPGIRTGCKSGFPTKREWARMNRQGMWNLQTWLTQAALSGKSEAALLDGFCQRALDVGFPIARGTIMIDTLHPVHEGRAFSWRSKAGRTYTDIFEYGPSSEGEVAVNWQRSPLFYLRESGESLFRVRFHAGDTSDSATIARLREEGMSEVAAMITRFPRSGAIGEMDALYAYWATNQPHGFEDAQVSAMADMMPMLALAIKCVSLARIAGTLVETYLGRDPGRRVLKGLIRRGVAEKINAVLWYSDLRSFTSITDHAAPEQIIPLLNDYAEQVIPSVYNCGGDVLKLIGDGILAIFHAAEADGPCGRAISAYDAVQERVARLNERRSRNGLPTTHVYVGLHVGEVFYGNIGSDERLDFTVVGPAVNEVARIAAMCRSVERSVLVSQAFAHSSESCRLVSVGRYALRGVERPQELFTLDPFFDGIPRQARPAG